MSRPAIRVSEKQFQSSIVQTAKLLHWRVYHTYDSRRSSPGFPDLVLVKPGTGVMFREVKTDHGRLTPEQRGWIDALESAGASSGIWRPSLWPLIEQELMGAA